LAWPDIIGEGPYRCSSERDRIDHSVIELLYQERATMPIVGDRPELSIKTVVYATDFSRCSKNAGDYAVRIAGYFSAKLLVAHAFTLSQAAMEVETGKILVSEQRKDLNSLLSRKAALLASDAVEAIPALLEGDPEKVIPELADEHAPSLIVFGTHGGGRLERSVIGSVAEGILRATRWPSLTVGPRARPISSTNFSFQRILFVTDFSTAVAQAAAFAVYCAETFGAQIDVLNAIHEDALKNPDRLSDLRNHFFNALDGLAPHQAKEFCDPGTYVAAGKAHDQILEQIKKRSIDLLVLGIRKSSQSGMEMRTSGVFQLIVDVNCPVLTIRR
jgi:nucleotide-binding universal stress UspA family protein